MSAYRIRKRLSRKLATNEVGRCSENKCRLEAVLEGNDERKTTDYFKIATTRIHLMKKPLILSNHI